MDNVNFKKKITWITPDYFVDCDLNPEIISILLEHFDIHWIVLLPVKDARFAEKDFVEIRQLPGLTIEFFYWKNRARNPKMLWFYERIYQRIIELNADLIYFNYVPTSPYVLPLYWRLKANKTIVTAHDGNVKPSFHMARMAKYVFNLAFGSKKYVNMFSQTEALVFKQVFKKTKIFVIPLSLKNFGESNLAKREDAIIFLFFGSIHGNKNLNILIDAACNLREKGITGFKVSIHGACNDFEPYQSRIKYPELFESDVRLHENVEIPDLFASSHYAVFPYLQVSQSGALKVAFNYEIPVIVSDLPGFTNEILPNTNGFIFKSEDVEDLERILTELILNHKNHYEGLQKRIITYNKDNYASSVLAQKYLNMFDHVLYNSN